MIKNASSFGLSQISQMPNMSQTLSGWMIPLTFGIVTKQQNGFYTREVVVNKSFQGVWQPLNMDQLQVKAEGERDWKWYWCHTQTDLGLKADDTVIYDGVQYRVMGAKDFSLNGFYEYELIEDFRNSGPYEEADDDADDIPAITPNNNTDDSSDDSTDSNSDLPNQDHALEENHDEGGGEDD